MVPGPAPRLERPLARRTLGLILGLGVVLASLLGLDLHHTYQSTHRAALENARLAAGLVEGTLTRTFESVETTLLALSDHIVSGSHKLSSDDEAQLRQTLQRTLEFAPHIRQIVLARPDGLVLFDSNIRLVGRPLDLDLLALADLSQDAVERGGTTRSLRFGLPVAGRFLPATHGQPVPSPSRLLPVGLKVRDDLIAVAALNPIALEDILGLPDVGPHGAMRLARFDGLPLLESAQGSSFLSGKRVSAEEAIAREQASGQIPLGWTTPQGTVMFQVSERYPMVIQAGVAREDVLRTWLGSESTVIYWSLTAFGGFFLLGGLLVREISRRSDLESQVRLLSLTQKVFANSAEAILITDAAPRIIAVNPVFTDVTGYTSDEVIGKNPNILASGRHDKGFYRDMWHSLETKNLWRGEIWNRKRDGTLYAQRVAISRLTDEAGTPLNYIAIFNDVTDQRRRAEVLHHQAHHDALTNLPNRSLLMDRLEQALFRADQDGTSVAVLFLDLDRFKPINDTHGHRVGDKVLEEVARRLLTAVRQSDTVARLGGDEFVILVHNVSGPPSVARIATKLVDSLKAPILVDEHLFLSVGASIGIALCPRHGTEARSLLAAADAAMYEAKRSGGDQWHFFPD
ncbi:diguanylate cyclase domain-containing protein [Pararhodospirillum photometricum]|uniref:diguanylate cyclase domain-containing protein n=1 Tax=Pararhodospirillum photometricum TaxID=1084 RepID=UPI00138B1662|nr:diguanylate cyclase [Pararhodospirillum photometricum]